MGTDFRNAATTARTNTRWARLDDDGLPAVVQQRQGLPERLGESSTLAECEAPEEGEFVHGDGVVVTVESSVLLSFVNGAHETLLLTVAAAGVTESRRTPPHGFAHDCRNPS